MTRQQNMPTAEDNNEFNESHVGVFQISSMGLIKSYIINMQVTDIVTLT